MYTRASPSMDSALLSLRGAGHVKIFFIRISGWQISITLLIDERTAFALCVFAASHRCCTNRNYYVASLFSLVAGISLPYLAENITRRPASFRLHISH